MSASVLVEISPCCGARVQSRWNEAPGGAQRENDSHHPVSTPSTLTVIRMGNGEMPVALVMSGTAVRPNSDEVWVSMTRRALVRVVARVALNSWRSVCRGGGGVAYHMINVNVRVQMTCKRERNGMNT